ncbi:alpha/beta fold hydrolase [Demequina sp. NBRC 110056]|uniref:alpha/beta fold hydrolase n=1 Tax=Demequina sp. NBRC 110056 TaxID=1570345 RepID=UPI000A01041F|nr:alpha/beta hydrolase [Demequina sp. NBRC 110056]
MARGSRTDAARYRPAEAALWEHFGVEPAERWAEVPGNGMRVRAQVVGEADAPAVVLVHGTPTAGGAWAPLVARLRGVRVIVVDRPGCGLSDPLDLGGFTPESMREVNAAWLGAVAEQIGGGPVDLVGNSAGGMASIMMAARRPELVRSLTLDGVPAVSGMRLPASMRAATTRVVASAAARRTVTASDMRRSLRAMGHTSLLAAGGLSQPELAWRAALTAHTDTVRNDLALLRLAASWRGLKRTWVPGPSEVGSLAVRSLWVVGDRDPFAAPERVRRWARHAPGSRVHVIEGAGHQPWLDGPEQHARLLEAFWDEPRRTLSESSHDSQPVPR